MSWYIKTLLLNAVRIRSKDDIDSDALNDLFIIEKKYSDLMKNGTITKYEDRIISTLKEYGNISTASKKLGIGNLTVKLNLERVATKLSLALGNIFTDDGYIDYMRTKYNLTKEQVEKLKQAIAREGIEFK